MSRQRAHEPDHYATLGIPPTASPAEVRAAYRRRSRDTHPDRNATPGAHRAMAAVNAAYAVLSDPARREDYDFARPKPKPPPRPAAAVPTSGRSAPQPARLPDWYEFLDLHMNVSTAEAIEAANRLGAEIRTAGYGEPETERLVLQLKEAVETLTNPRTRKIYDAALCGTPPPPGSYAYLHEDWYSFLGVRRTSSLDRIAEQVTAISGRLRKDSPEYREVEAAWRTLRDPELRAKYDTTL